MTVQFFRLIIKGTNEAKLLGIKEWLDTKIDAIDLHNNIGDGEVKVFQELDGSEYVLQLNAYFNKAVNKAKYKDIIIAQFSSMDKTSLTEAYIEKYDDCTHDEPNPQPCVVTRVLEWNSE